MFLYMEKIFFVLFFIRIVFLLYLLSVRFHREKRYLKGFFLKSIATYHLGNIVIPEKDTRLPFAANKKKEKITILPRLKIARTMKLNTSQRTSSLLVEVAIICLNGSRIYTVQ